MLNEYSLKTENLKSSSLGVGCGANTPTLWRTIMLWNATKALKIVCLLWHYLWKGCDVGTWKFRNLCRAYLFRSVSGFHWTRISVLLAILKTNESQPSVWRWLLHFYCPGSQLSSYLLTRKYQQLWN